MKAQNLRHRVTTAGITEWHDTELSCQGLRILARMVARHYLDREVARKVNNDTKAKVKNYSGRQNSEDG